LNEWLTVLKAFQALLQGTIPSILNAIVCASLKTRRDFAPLIAELCMEFNKMPIFAFCPRVVVERGVEMVFESFTALLSGASLEH
jgi:hypothetical protein